MSSEISGFQPHHLSEVFPSSRSSSSCKRRCSLFKVLSATAVLVALLGASILYPNNQQAPIRIENCNSRGCPPIPFDKLRPSERVVNRELLRLKYHKGSKIGLWITAGRDVNEALPSVGTHFNKIVTSLTTGNRQLKYSEVQNYEEICKEIESAASIGSVDLVVLNMHGNRLGMVISKTSELSLFNKKMLRSLNPKFAIRFITLTTNKYKRERFLLDRFNF